MPYVYFVHASARSDRDNISAHTIDSMLEAMFPEVQSGFIVRGHDHFAATRSWDGVTEAQYLLLETLAHDLEVRGNLELSECFSDGTFVSAKKGFSSG